MPSLDLDLGTLPSSEDEDEEAAAPTGETAAQVFAA